MKATAVGVCANAERRSMHGHGPWLQGPAGQWLAAGRQVKYVNFIAKRVILKTMNLDFDTLK